MPAFDAGAVIEALDWDFTAAGVKAKGTVPEPSDQMIGDFLDGIKKLYSGAKEGGLIPDLGTDPSPERMMEAVAKVTGAAYVTFMDALAGLFAALCSDHPGKTQLLALPLRVRVKFYAWMQNEVVNPEASPGAGIAELRSLPSAAAG